MSKRKQLTPSRELDVLIAEEVMGWRRENDRFEWPCPYSWIHVKDVPKFSTEIGAAWEIVEKLFSPTRNFALTGSLEPLQWNATFVPIGPGSVAYAASNIAAHAICLAALKVNKGIPHD